MTEEPQFPLLDKADRVFGRLVTAGYGVTAAGFLISVFLTVTVIALKKFSALGGPDPDLDWLARLLIVFVGVFLGVSVLGLIPDLIDRFRRMR